MDVEKNAPNHPGKPLHSMFLLRNGVILDLKLKLCRGQYYHFFLSVSINKIRLEGAAVSLFIVFILLHCPEANKYALTQHTSTNILRLYFTSILLQKDAANIIKECINVIFTLISHFFRGGILSFY